MYPIRSRRSSAIDRPPLVRPTDRASWEGVCAPSVLPGKGQIEVSWLWIARNRSNYGPSHFAGVVDGGTGTFAGVRGQFTATLLPGGAPMITVTFR
jgi:hypothetical protein